MPLWTRDDRIRVSFFLLEVGLLRKKFSQVKIKPGYARSVKVPMTPEDFFFCHGILSAVLCLCIKDFL